MLKREHYLQAIRAFYETDLIKIITGIRRCGKSVILNQIRDELAVTTTNKVVDNNAKVVDIMVAVVTSNAKKK